jgi:putative membrane protein
MLVAMAAATLVAGTAAFAQHKAPAEAVGFAKKVASANTSKFNRASWPRTKLMGDVKSFADQMIKDHTKAGHDFKLAVAEANISPSPPEEPNAKDKAKLAKLKSAEGAAFDNACVSAQLTAHKDAVSFTQTGTPAGCVRYSSATMPRGVARRRSSNSLRARYQRLNITEPWRRYSADRPSWLANRLPRDPVARRSVRRCRRHKRPTSHSASARRSGCEETTLARSRQMGGSRQIARTSRATALNTQMINTHMK